MATSTGQASAPAAPGSIGVAIEPQAEKLWAEVPNGRVLPYECDQEAWDAKLEELAQKAGVKLP